MNDIKQLIKDIREWQAANIAHTETRLATDGTAFVSFCRLSDAGKTVTGHSHDDDMDNQTLAAFVALADEIERLQKPIVVCPDCSGIDTFQDTEDGEYSYCTRCGYGH